MAKGTQSVGIDGTNQKKKGRGNAIKKMTSIGHSVFSRPSLTKKNQKNGIKMYRGQGK